MLPETKRKSYHKLTVYQKAKELVLSTYKLTKGFPQEERYVLVPQMRRSAISIVANIVEGYIKKSKKEYSRFLDISIGSATELGFYFELSVDLEYLSRQKLNKAGTLLVEVKKLLYSYQRSLRASVR